MKGLIEQLWENHDRKGQRYLVLEIAGERYSLWDEALMDNLEEGLVVDYYANKFSYYELCRPQIPMWSAKLIRIWAL